VSKELTLGVILGTVILVGTCVLSAPRPRDATFGPGVSRILTAVPIPQAPEPKGADLMILSEKGRTVLLGGDQFAYEELQKSLIAGDTDGAVELIRLDRAFGVDRPVKVLVIDRSPLSVRVRILEGKNRGKAGWVGWGDLHYLTTPTAKP
jgi:hypothetical protein